MRNPPDDPAPRDSEPDMSVTVETVELRHDGLIALVQDVGRSGAHSGWAWMVTVAIAIHFVALWGAGRLFPTALHAGPVPTELETIEAPDVERPPAPAAEPEPPAPREPQKQPSPPLESPPQDPSARAQAGKVLIAPAQSQTRGQGDAIVSGDHDQFAGGSTSPSGTATQDVAPPTPPVAAARSAAPPPPPPVDTVAATRAYLGRVRQALAREKRYPAVAQRLGIEGTVVVAFSIGSTGAFSRVAVAASSGNDILDQAALAAVSALSGRIPRPAETGEIDLPLRTSLQFELPK